MLKCLQVPLHSPLNPLLQKVSASQYLNAGCCLKYYNAGRVTLERLCLLKELILNFTNFSYLCYTFAIDDIDQLDLKRGAVKTCQFS